jgi:hypothetical protein
MAAKPPKKTSTEVSVKNSLGHGKSSPATLRAIELGRARMRAEGRRVPKAR